MNRLIHNITKGKITTAFGVLFRLGSLIMFMFPLFRADFDVDSVVLTIGATIGIGLILSPDDLFKRLKDKI